MIEIRDELLILENEIEKFILHEDLMEENL